MRIDYCTDSRGQQPVYDWIQHIQKHEPTAYRKFYQLQVMLKENGKLIHSGEIKRKDIKKLKGKDIWQLRINDHRILFFYFQEDTIVFTNNFTKKQNVTPKSEIARAETRKERYLSN
jgi:mRNA-degrading endonuclease RelE of RelBE toxin-antitoxin system